MTCSREQYCTLRGIYRYIRTRTLTACTIHFTDIGYRVSDIGYRVSHIGIGYRIGSLAVNHVGRNDNAESCVQFSFSCFVDTVHGMNVCYVQRDNYDLREASVMVNYACEVAHVFTHYIPLIHQFSIHQKDRFVMKHF